MRKISVAIATLAYATLTGAELAFDADSILAENDPRPETNDKWAQFWFKPNNPHVASLGSGGLDEVTGVFLVNLHYPLDTGSAEGKDAVGTFRRAFVAGTRLIFEGQEVRIVNCGANLGRIVDTWYRADIQITWVAYLQRGVA